MTDWTIEKIREMLGAHGNPDEFLNNSPKIAEWLLGEITFLKSDLRKAGEMEAFLSKQCDQMHALIAKLVEALKEYQDWHGYNASERGKEAIAEAEKIMGRECDVIRQADKPASP